MRRKEIEELLTESRIKKTVNRKGQIRKSKTAGRKGKTVKGGKIKTLSGVDKKAQKLGLIKRKKSLRRKSSFKKRKSAKFAAMGRAKRAKMGTKDNRKG